MLQGCYKNKLAVSEEEVEEDAKENFQQTVEVLDVVDSNPVPSEVRGLSVARGAQWRMEELRQERSDAAIMEMDTDLDSDVGADDTTLTAPHLDLLPAFGDNSGFGPPAGFVHEEPPAAAAAVPSEAAAAARDARTAAFVNRRETKEATKAEKKAIAKQVADEKREAKKKEALEKKEALRLEKEEAKKNKPPPVKKKKQAPKPDTPPNTAERKRTTQIAENNGALIKLGLAVDPTNTEMVALLKSKGRVVRIPASAFPGDEAPACGFWEGKTVQRRDLGGATDVAIKIVGEDVFVRPALEVLAWGKGAVVDMVAGECFISQ